MMAQRTNHVGGTFGWTPAACVGRSTNIETILRDDVLANVQEMERVALEVLGPLVDRFEQVGDVRAAGALIGVEFVTDMETIMPGAELPARRPPRRAAPRRARDHPGGQVGLPAAAGAEPADRALPLVLRAGRRRDRRGRAEPAGRAAERGAMRRLGALAGYADRLSARPGESLRLMVSAAGEIEAEVVEPGRREPSRRSPSSASSSPARRRCAPERTKSRPHAPRCGPPTRSPSRRGSGSRPARRSAAPRPDRVLGPSGDDG